MASAGWIRRFLTKNGFNVFEWGTCRRSNYLETPNEPGVYALYWGDTLQYIGKSRYLRGRLSPWDSEGLYKTEIRIPFGSFAWFTLPTNQIQDAEALLIRKYDPPYNKDYPYLSRKWRNL